MMNETMLDPLQYDLLTEMFNVGIGQAAASLSQLTHQEIQLSVPEIQFIAREAFVALLGKERDIYCISQTMSGPFNAESMLMFAEDKSLTIVKKMLGGEIADEALTDLQQEALVEIGNIVLNACIAGIANMLDTPFIIELPQFDLSNPDTLLARHLDCADDIILILQIALTLKESAVSGYLAFIFQPTSVIHLKQSLSQRLQQIIVTQ